MSTKPITLFYSYSHDDEALRLKLQKHLAVLRRKSWIAEWHDRNIDAGEGWAVAIDRNLASADIVLLLVSASFIASDYCWGKEMAQAMERYERGQSHIIPVILQPCQWRETPIADLQVTPTDGKPVTEWSNEQAALNDVAEKIIRVVRDLREKHAKEEGACKRRAEEERVRAEAETKRRAEEERQRGEAQRTRSFEGKSSSQTVSNVAATPQDAHHILGKTGVSPGVSQEATVNPGIEISCAEPFNGMNIVCYTHDSATPEGSANTPHGKRTTLTWGRSTFIPLKPRIEHRIIVYLDREDIGHSAGIPIPKGIAGRAVALCTIQDGEIKRYVYMPPAQPIVNPGQLVSEP
jgi:hypothetical protein